MEGHILWQLIAEICRRSPQAREGAVIWRRGSEDHGFTEVILAGAAIATPATRVAGLQGNAVASFERRDLVTDLDDGASRFVAEDHGITDDKVANGAMLPVVNIGAADSRVVYGDKDIMGRVEGWFGAIDKRDRERLVEDEGEVLQETDVSGLARF